VRGRHLVLRVVLFGVATLPGVAWAAPHGRSTGPRPKQDATKQDATKQDVVKPTQPAEAGRAPQVARNGPDEDVVETIEPLPDVPASAKTAPGAAPSPPNAGGTAPRASGRAPDGAQASSGSFVPTLTGWWRIAVETGTKRAGYYRNAPDTASVPYDQVVFRAQNHLRLRLAKERAFEAVLSGLFLFDVFEEDAENTRTFWGFNGQDVRTHFEALLRELYLGWFSRRVDLRVGQQRVVWGRGDAFTPNDILCARDLRDPILAESEVLHMPVPLLRLTLDPGPLTLEGVFAPFFIPDRFAVYGHNWSFVQPDAPEVYRRLLFIARSLVDPTLESVLEPLLGQSATPPHDLRGSQAGLRLGRSFHRGDVDLYYHYGYDRRPLLKVDPAVVERLAAADLSSANPAVLTPLLEAMGASERPFEATYRRRHHVGLSGQATWGLWTLRADLAYDSTFVAVRREDLTGKAMPSLMAVVGTEYMTGEHGNSIIAEVAYQRLFDAPPDGTLLGFHADSVSFAAHWQWTFFDRLEVELVGVLGLKPFSFSVKPQVGWKWRSLTFRLGVLVLDGVDESLPHYYRRNGCVYGVVRQAY